MQRYICWVMPFFLLCITISPVLVAEKGAEDLEAEDFEQGNLNWFVLGFPSGTPVDSHVELTSAQDEVKSGKKALAFRYQRNSKPIPILFHAGQLTDFEYIDFWVKSKKNIKWAVVVSDLDGATFNSIVNIPPEKWIHVHLKPSDFKCNDDSKVKKDSLDSSRAGYGCAGFDVIAVLLGGKGDNAVFFDQFVVARRPFKFTRENYTLKNESITIYESTRISGDLDLVNGAKLIVKANRFEVGGKITIKDSTLQLTGGCWSLPQRYRYQGLIVVSGKGSIIFENGILDSSMLPIGFALIEGARCQFSNIEMFGGFTCNVAPDCAIQMENSKRLGEFLIFRGAKFYSQNSEDFLIWLRCGEKITSNLSLPDGGNVAQWSAPTDLRRSLSISNCRNVTFGLIADPGCGLTIHNSSLRAVGLLFNNECKASVKGLKNEGIYKDLKVDTEQHTLRFVKTEVLTWNFYSSDKAKLKIINCIYGESVSFNNSTIEVFDSICDGSGGYIGAKEDSTTIYSGGEIRCNLLTHDRAKLILTDSHVKGNIEATERSTVELKNTKVEGTISEIGQGKVIKK